MPSDLNVDHVEIEPPRLCQETMWPMFRSGRRCTPSMARPAWLASRSPRSPSQAPARSRPFGNGPHRSSECADAPWYPAQKPFPAPPALAEGWPLALVPFSGRSSTRRAWDPCARERPARTDLPGPDPSGRKLQALAKKDTDYQIRRRRRTERRSWVHASSLQGSGSRKSLGVQTSKLRRSSFSPARRASVGAIFLEYRPLGSRGLAPMLILGRLSQNCRFSRGQKRMSGSGVASCPVSDPARRGAPNARRGRSAAVGDRRALQGERENGTAGVNSRVRRIRPWNP